jgi:hypothetical protein
MMSLVDMTLVAEHAAVVARLEADLVIAASGNGEHEVHQLRRRVLTAYRSALSAAAGKPFHPNWGVLAQSVDAFVARVGASARTHDARAALARLDSLRFELLPELLELGGSAAG